MRRSFLVSILAFGLIAAGCSSDSDAGTTDSSTTTTAAETTTTTVAETTTTTAAETTTTTADPGFVEATDLVYMTIDGSELLLDVYTPVGEGPWPLVGRVPWP